ncbi:hypothetical protein [Campylobacter coli]|uniref:hypothetical protein n=1 Tax=Campylobacter coli TaxID=195 RepID=UPI000AE937C3|nr:hypothetical protein [Campylobacter coli]
MTGTNVDGMMSGAKLSAGAMTTVNSVSQANSDAWNKNFNDQYSHMSQSSRSSALNEAKGFMEKGDEVFKKAFANNIGQEIQNRTDLTSEEKAEIALAASAHAGFSVFGNGAEIQSSASSKRGIGIVETFSEAQKAAYNEIMERTSLKTLSTTKGMDSSWSNTLSGGNSIAYSKMVGYAQSIVSPNNTTMPHAAGMNFKTIDGSERSVLTQSKLNQDQVNQSGKKASDTTTMLDSQEVKSGATHSQIAEDNKKGGNTIRETSKNWNPLGKDTPPII